MKRDCDCECQPCTRYKVKHQYCAFDCDNEKLQVWLLETVELFDLLKREQLALIERLRIDDKECGCAPGGYDSKCHVYEFNAKLDAEKQRISEE